MYLDYPNWLSLEARTTLERGYLLKKGDKLINGEVLDETETPKDAYWRVANRTVEIYPELDYIKKDLFHCLHSGWIGLATPVFTNFGADRGLPISCFLTHLGDSIDSIYGHKLTVAQMSKNGGGVATYFGDIRPGGSPISNGGISSSIQRWVKEYDLTASTVTQGKTRRGSIVGVVPIEHSDLPEILMSKDHTHGDPRNFIDCNIAVTVSDQFMTDLINGNQEYKEIMDKVLELRVITGSPYILFIDTINRANPPSYNKLGLDVSMSNLCSEITLHTSPEYSAVCCLSSMNLSRWDEYEFWTGESGFTAVELATIMLDAVMEEFILKAKEIRGMEPAVRFSEKSRALGLGVQGLASYYQLHNLPFKSTAARAINIEIHKKIQEQCIQASEYMGKLYGIPEWCVEEQRRNSHLMAVAPTRTNSVITGALSPGVEPMEYNYYTAKQNKSTFIRRNPHLEKLINQRVNEDTKDEVWESILNNKGSINHLPQYFSKYEMEIFKTAREVDQLELLKQASDRQKYICQAQSLNLFADSDVTLDELYEQLIYAWHNEVKTLYYFKGKSKITDRKDIFAKPNSDGTYVIITKKECPYCIKLKDQLKDEGRKFNEIPLDQAKETGIWDENWKTVPQLFIDGTRIGGYDSYFLMTHDNEQIEYEECANCDG